MVPEPKSSSAGQKYECCPIPKTHRRLAEAHLLWHQALEAYHDPEAFRANLNATIEALRNITFVLQNERGRFADFDKWYGPWQARLKANTAAKWLHDARTTVVHQGELDSHSTAEVRLLTWRDEIITRLNVPAEMPSSLILQNLPLVNLVSNSPLTTEGLKDGLVAIERRWTTTDLGTDEILAVLAQVYGLLSDMLLDAHIHLGQADCIPRYTEHSDFPSTYHRTGILECMASGPDRRTRAFKTTGDEVSYSQVFVPTSVDPHEAIRRYGLDENDKLAPWETLDPVRFAERVLHSAKRILRRDGNHARMMFIRDGLGEWHLLPLQAKDNAEKHLLMHIVARFVETRGGDAIIEVGEMWTARAEPQVQCGIPHENARGEALVVMVITRQGFFREYVTPFKRGPFGGIKLGDTHELDPVILPYLEPVLVVWRRQGYVSLPDGKAMRRIWEPDPLDVCFCGGPERFAECCRRHLPLDTTVVDREVDKAIAASDLKRAEDLARAALAQYVIWVKQHTADMINVAPEAYKMFVDVDVPALESHVLILQTSLDANGRGELFVAQVRHLARIIGVPRLSVRLTALVSRWFMRSGRTEEAILELDGLGDLDKVDDTLALITATHIYDLSPQRTEELLHKAIASAVFDNEKWVAQLELAEHVLASGRREEAMQLVDIVIAESGRSNRRSDGSQEALILRWRITKEANDFGAALEAMQRGDDEARHRDGGILIDEGMYADGEQLLSGQIKQGDPTAKLLIVDARVRSGNTGSARDLLLSVRPEQISNRLKYAYAVACSIVALSSRDAEIRTMAVRAIQALPASAQEGDKNLRTMMQALKDDALGS
jgi:hypothetical protein